MYESPIEKIVQHIQENLIKQEEDHLMAQITETVGYQINKEELIKALKYDRNQYHIGFKDALACLTDRPCDVCKFHTEKGCKKWTCVFEEEPDDTENKGEWIPVSERLPKERQAVLCWAENTAERLDAEFIGMHDTGDWFLQSDANHLSFPHQYNVVAWMPLPKPYKADMRGEEK